MRCYSILLIKHVIHVHSSLPPQCRVGFSYSSMHPFLFTGHPPVSSNQYGPIILLRPNAQQTITFSTVSERYRCSWGCASFPHILYKNALSVCSFPTRWKFASSLKNEAQEIRMIFDSLTGGLPKGTSLSLISIGLLVVESVSYTETGEDPGALCS